MAVKNVNNEKAQQFLEFLSSIGSDRERYNAMVTVLLHAGRGSQTVDDFEMRTRLNMGTPAECLVSPNVSFDIFRDDYLRKGRIDFDRVHQIDDRFFGFETKHYVYPYVGYGTKEFEIGGVCVSDVRQGRNVSRMADVGIGDDSTWVYAGKNPIEDGRRVAGMYKRLLPMFKGDESRTVTFIEKAEESMYSVFNKKPSMDRDVDERRYVGEIKAVMADWHPNVFPSQRNSCREKVAVAIYKSAREAQGIDLNRRRYSGKSKGL